MLCRRVSDTSPGSRSARDTVIAPTPARAATSAIVGRPSPRRRRAAPAVDPRLCSGCLSLLMNLARGDGTLEDYARLVQPRVPAAIAADLVVVDSGCTSRDPAEPACLGRLRLTGR